MERVDTAAGEVLLKEKSRLLLSRFLPVNPLGPSQNAAARLGSSIHSALGCPKEMGQKKENHIMYLNHVQLIGFLGKDPEKRQVRGNGANFTLLSVATQQSWKDSNEEWQSKTEWHRVVAFNRLGESIAGTLHKGDHVLVDGQLVSSKYERENGKPRRARPPKSPSSGACAPTPSGG